MGIAPHACAPIPYAQMTKMTDEIKIVILAIMAKAKIASGVTDNTTNRGRNEYIS